MSNRNLTPKVLAVTIAAICAASTPVFGAETNVDIKEKSNLEIETITVTSSRRSQTTTDVPYNVTAISGDKLEAIGVNDMSGLMKQIPGIVYSDTGGRGNAMNSGIVLRGLNVVSQASGTAFPGLSVPTVSTYMDDTPLFLNLKMTDISRVEVLRGPQGTLYGSGSLAGTMRFIHNRPDVDQLSGSIAAGTEFLGDSDDQTYTADGMLNIPLSDNLAFRVAATYKDQGGVIDAHGMYKYDDNGAPVLANPGDLVNSPAATTTVKDHDSSETYGIRSSLLWFINDDVSAYMVYHHQHTEASGNNFRDLGQDESVVSVSRAIDQLEQNVDIYSVEVEADLGFATLTSTTSYSKEEHQVQRDLSFLPEILDAIPAFGAEGCAFYGCFPRSTLIGNEPGEREDFTQEFRLMSNDGDDIDWLIGAYYNEQEAALIMDQAVAGYAQWANLPDSGDAIIEAYTGIPTSGSGVSFYNYWLAVGGVANPADEANQFFNDRTTTFEDKALYGEITYHVSDEWQITAGARYFEQEYESNLLAVFSNCGVACSDSDHAGDVRGVSESSSQWSTKDQIFKLNTSYELSDNINWYFTWAQGFRHGGANALPVGAFSITQDMIEYEADETTNWEMGLKGLLWDNRLDFTLAAFFIDWDKPQLDTAVSFAALPAIVQGESAQSKGIEFALSGRLTENLSFGLGYNFTDAEITEEFSYLNSGGGHTTINNGSSLPGIAKHQANLKLDYEQPLDGDFDLHYHLNGQYKGKAENFLDGSGKEFAMDGFMLWNASVSLNAEDWSLTASVTNLLNENEAITTVSLSMPMEVAARPRSFGVRLKYNF